MRALPRYIQVRGVVTAFPGVGVVTRAPIYVGYMYIENLSGRMYQKSVGGLILSTTFDTFDHLERQWSNVSEV